MIQNIADVTTTHRHSIRDRAAPVRHMAPLTRNGRGRLRRTMGLRFDALLDTVYLGVQPERKIGAAKLPEDLTVQDWGIT